MRKQSYYNTLLHQKGFSLVETIIAITILIFAIAAPLTIATQSLFATTTARNQLIATYLAQESIEFVRNIRDTNSITGGVDWLDGLDNCLGGSACTIDLAEAPGSEVALCGGSCEALRYDPTTFRYGYNASWDETGFTRTVMINEFLVPSNQEATVTVTVTWQDGLLNRQVQVTEHIFNWQ